MMKLSTMIGSLHCDVEHRNKTLYLSKVTQRLNLLMALIINFNVLGRVIWGEGLGHCACQSICLFSSFQLVTIQIQIDKSIDGVHGIQTQGSRSEGADTTEYPKV